MGLRVLGVVWVCGVMGFGFRVCVCVGGVLGFGCSVGVWGLGFRVCVYGVLGLGCVCVFFFLNFVM